MTANVELTGAAPALSAQRPATEGSEVERRVGPRHPTLDECGAAGMGPTYMPGHGYTEGGLRDTPEERARFEAYMRGHCWDVGGYDDAKHCYDTVGVRMLYGVWRDRGALPTTWPNIQGQGPAPADR